MTHSQKVALLILSKSIKAMSQPKATTANEHSSDETKMKHAPSPLRGLRLGPGFSRAPRAKSLQEDAVSLDPLPTADITGPFKHHPGASILKQVTAVTFSNDQLALEVLTIRDCPCFKDPRHPFGSLHTKQSLLLSSTRSFK